MKKYAQWLVVSFVSFLAMGCSFVPEQLSLHPVVNSSSVPNVGRGQVVALNVIDARTQKSVGNRPSGLGPMAAVTLANNPEHAIYDAVSTGLSARGFKPVDYATHRREPISLTLTLRELGYEQKMSIMMISVLAHSSIGAEAKHNGARYSKVYRADEVKNYPIVPTTGQDETHVNAVLSDNLNRIFFDKNLMNFLAR